VCLIGVILGTLLWAEEPGVGRQFPDSVSTTTFGWAGSARDSGRNCTVIDHATITRSGSTTIADLSAIVPGLYPINTAYDNSVLVSRGTRGNEGERQLILIDGITVNSSLNGHAPIDRELPLLLADRVELSPSSAALCHGNGAINGLINIVPATPVTDGAGGDARMGIGVESGTPDNITGSLREALVHRGLFGSYNIVRWGDGHIAALKKGREFQIAFGYYKREASHEFGRLLNESTAEYDLGSPTAPFDNSETAYFGRVQGRVTDGILHGLGIGVINLSRKTGFGISWTPEVLKPSVSNSQSMFTLIPYLRFDRDLTHRTRLNLRATWNYSRERGWNENDAGNWAPRDSNGASAYSLAASDLAIDGKYTFAVTKNISLVAGMAFNRAAFDTSEVWLHQSGAFFGPDGADSVGRSPHARIGYAAFLSGRAEAPLLQGLVVTAGLRSDNTTWNGVATNLILPSLSAALTLGRGFGVRAMYNSGFLNPALEELAWNEVHSDGLQKRGLQRDLASLHPEIMHMIEGSLMYDKAPITGMLTPFYTIGQDRIERRLWQGSTLPELERNSGTIYRSNGIEGRLAWQVLPIVRATVGADYCRTWADYGPHDFLPDGRIATVDTVVDNIYPDGARVKGYACIEYTAPFGLNVFTVFKGIRPAGWTSHSREPDTWLLDVNLTQPIGEVVVISLKGANVLNYQNYYYRGAVPGANRTIILSLSRGL
jgi:hypothetical protein